MEEYIFPFQLKPRILIRMTTVFSKFFQIEISFQSPNLFKNIGKMSDELLINAICRKFWENKETRPRCYRFRKNMLKKAEETRKVIIKQCYANLVEIAIPIFTSREKFLGLLYFNQIQPMEGIQNSKNYQEFFKKYSKLLSVDAEVLLNLYLSCPQYNQATLDNFVSLGKFFALYIRDEIEEIKKPLRKYKSTHPRKFVRISFAEIKQLFFLVLKTGNKKKLDYLLHQIIDFRLTPSINIRKFLAIYILTCFIYDDLEIIFKDYQPNFKEIFLKKIITIISCQNIESLYGCLSEIINYYSKLYKKYYSSFNKEFFNEVTSFIDENYAKHLTREDMAKKFHYHPVYFSRIFKEIMGITYQDYLRKVRIEKSKELMKKTSLTISEIAFEVGYRNFNVFWEAFKSREKISPKEWRKKL